MGLRTRARTEDRTLDEADDARMLRLAAGDKETLRELMECHGGVVLSFLYRMTGDRGGSEDLTQETFLRVFRNAASYRPGQGFRPWLFTIARNLALNHRRRKGLEARTRPHPNGRALDPAAQVENGELRRKVEENLQLVEEPYRSALVLCVLQGLSYEEAAEVCGCSVKTLSSRLARGRSRFRVLMDPYLRGNGNGKL